ncbi:MarR family transcriptional regulator [Marinobacter halodurans]|uniref:MarR family transcriptional regulator n=1 Tax=Marinobacter halodurans TaxID=2528979 RepID=A0ABY1ZJA4_9GAMM|nr:MarR family transcriptional regulator [Marinobacter halodurans]TBW51248.1 MarR family transcriptional regulator [Marinobacter halodurans]
MTDSKSGGTESAGPLTLSIHDSLKPSLGGALGRLHRLWRRAITDAVSPMAMTESRWSVMVHLFKLGEGVSQQSLARELEIEMPSLTRTLNQLEDQALIERRPDPHDRRAHTLWFTPRGRELVTQMEARIKAVRADICEGLTAEQLDQFAQVITVMENNVRQHLAGAKPKESSPS